MAWQNGQLSLGSRPTPFCLYRIAETGLSVASDSREKGGNRVRGSIDRSWGAEPLAYLRKAGAEFLAGALIVEQAQNLCSHFCRGEVLLNQLRNHAALSDQVHHTEVRRTDQGLGEQSCERRHAIDDDHGDIEERGFDRSRAARDDGGISGS